MTDFVFSRLYMDSFNLTNNVNNYFDKFEIYNSNVYQILNQIPQNNIIYYIYLSAFIFFVISFYEIKLNHILVFLILIVVIGYLIQKDFGQFNDYISLKKDQLNFLNKLCFDGSNYSNFGPKDTMNIQPPITKSYLYLNPLIVEFYYNIREFSQYNLSSYVSSIIHTNNVIALHQQMKEGLENPFQNLDVAKQEIAGSLNSLESLIYKLPVSDVSDTKYKKSVDVLQSILMRYIIEMEDICERKNNQIGYTMYSKPNDKLDSSFDVSPNDIQSKDYNASYNLFNE